MINVTETAQSELKTYFESREIKPIRVHLADGGCGGMRLSMAFDEFRDGDETVELEPFTFLINKELAEAAGVVTVNMGDYGFELESENSIGGGGGGCGGCSGSCG